MFRPLCKNVWVLVTLILSMLVLTIAAKAQIAAGFYQHSSGITTGFSWNVDTNAVVTAANGAGGANTAMFGVSQNAKWFCGVADNSSGFYQGAIWNGVNGAATVALADSGRTSFPGNDDPWSINDSGNSVGQGSGQINGYDTGYFAAIEWTAASNWQTIIDLNGLNDPNGNPIYRSSYYGGPVYLEGYDFTGLDLSAAGINNEGDISCTAFQNFGSFYYQGVIIHNGKIYVLPYTDAADPEATSWNISSSSATTGYTFTNSLTRPIGYTASVNSSGYTFGINGGSGSLANYGSGPNNNFQWFIDTNDDGSGSGQAVGFDIDSTGSYNHDVYDANNHTAVEIRDDRGGNTTFLVGVANDGSSAGFETIAADGEAYFHAWGTQTGTPGATADFPDASVGAVGSKAFEVSTGAPPPGVKTFTGQYNAKRNTYKPIVLKHGKTAKVSVILTSAAGVSGQVVLVTSSNTSAIANFTLTVPAGQTTLNNVKTPKVSKKAKGQTVTLTASAPGGSQSVTVTIQ